ncbi:MAG: ABC transporter permease, partial [Thermoleophilaceae bacterium]
MDTLLQDLRYALRSLRKSPGFTAIAVLTLALGIGATTAIFSAVDHVLLRPLPYHEADRVVTLWETAGSMGGTRREVAPGNFLEWERRTTSFSPMGLAEPFGHDLTGQAPPVPLDAWRVTEGFFDALGVEPVVGRTFLAEEYVPDAPPVVLLSHEVWQQRYGSDPDIVGRRIEVDFTPATVVGVLPPGLEYPSEVGLWTPKTFQVSDAYDERTERAASYMQAIARLKPGVTLEQARGDMERAAAALAAEYPETNAETGVQVVPIEKQVLGEVRTGLLVLFGAVTFLLLIACANVASLLLARGSERGRELGVRAALGAGRTRLTRQLVTESLVLAAMGGVAGVALAYLGVRAFALLAPHDLPRLDTLGIDGRVLVFAIGSTLVTTLVSGLAPALRFSRPDVLPALQGGGRSGTPGRTRNRLRRALVVAQVALALMLLIGSGLLARSFVRLLSNDPGFAVERRATLQVFLWDRNPTAADRIRRVREIDARMEAVPGVEAAAVVSALPFHPQQIDAGDQLIVEDRPLTDGQIPRVFTTTASPDYFQVMGIPLVRGRMFTDRDREDAPRVALINETLARRFFAGEDPVGQRVTIGVMSAPATREIVGVVRDVRPTTLDSDPRPELYVPYAQSGTGSVTFVVRTRTDASALLPTLREQIWQVDPAQSIDQSAALEDLVSETLVERRFHLSLLGGFSVLALMLAAIGIYGLINFITRRRLREIGIRLALGAAPAAVRSAVLRNAMGMVTAGMAAGVIGALLLTRLMRSMLYEVSPA